MCSGRFSKSHFISLTIGMLLNISTTTAWVISQPRFHSWQELNMVCCDDVFQSLTVSHHWQHVHVLCVHLSCAQSSLCPTSTTLNTRAEAADQETSSGSAREECGGGAAEHPVPSKHIIRALSRRRMTLYDSFQTDLTAVVPLIDSAERDLTSSELISISMLGWKKGACFSSASAKMSYKSFFTVFSLF